MDQALQAPAAATAAPGKFIGKGICATCHGRGQYSHPHMFRIGTDDPCEQCNGSGAIPVECDTQELADRYNMAFEKRRNDIESGEFLDFPAAAMGALALL